MLIDLSERELIALLSNTHEAPGLIVDLGAARQRIRERLARHEAEIRLAIDEVGALKERLGLAKKKEETP